MVDTYTQGKLGLIEAARGSYVDTWDEPLYANWQTLEAAVSGTTTINLSSSNIVLTVPTFPAYPDPPTVSTSAQNLRLLLTGAPTVNLIVYIPATIAGFWIVDDQTTGSSTVTIKTTAVSSTGITTSKNNTLVIYCDGTNVKLADSGNRPTEIVIPGTVVAFGGTSTPSGYLACNGTAYSRTTYASLFAAIGTTWGNGDGVNTFNVPNLVGQFLRGVGGNGPATVGASQANQVGPHNHTATVTDPGHRHNIGMYQTVSDIFQFPEAATLTIAMPQSTPNFVVSNYRGLSSIVTTGVSVTVNNSTGTETRPDNYGINYIIKT